jgi:hypothetical protein
MPLMRRLWPRSFESGPLRIGPLDGPWGQRLRQIFCLWSPPPTARPRRGAYGAVRASTGVVFPSTGRKRRVALFRKNENDAWPFFEKLDGTNHNAPEPPQLHPNGAVPERDAAGRVAGDDCALVVVGYVGNGPD